MTDYEKIASDPPSEFYLHRAPASSSTKTTKQRQKEDAEEPEEDEEKGEEVEGEEKKEEVVPFTVSQSVSGKI